jgi:hypothetical protein
LNIDAPETLGSRCERERRAGWPVPGSSARSSSIALISDPGFFVE